MDPLLQYHSAPPNLPVSFDLLPRSSPALSPRQSLTGASPPLKQTAAGHLLPWSHLSAMPRPKLAWPVPCPCYSDPSRPEPLRCSSPERRLRHLRPPPAAGALGPAAISHPEPSRSHLEVRLVPLLLSHPDPLAAGEPSRRKWPAPFPLFSSAAKDPVLEGTKVPGGCLQTQDTYE